MRLFLGVDGGGTKTEALVCDEKGIVSGRGTSGPSNPIFTDISAAMGSITKSIKEAAYGAGNADSFNYAAICIPGMRKYEEQLKTDFANEIQRLYVSGDETSVFHSALAVPFGIVVSAGTGSFAMGVNRKGENAEIGGWGPVLGDEGSAYYIGVLALKAVIREYEEREFKTLLTDKLKEHLGIGKITELRHVIYRSDSDRFKISQISKLVHSAANEGDDASLEIIKAAAKQLADLVGRTVKRLSMYDDEYDAVLTGGVSNVGDFLLTPFTEYVKEKNTNINVRKPKFKPSVGALLIAMKESGIDIYDKMIINNLESSYDKIMLSK